MEKRQNKRFIKRCDVEFIINDTTFRGISSNVSSHGLFIRTNRPPRPDSLLLIRLHLPDGSASKITGRVRRAVKTPITIIKNGMGVEIVEQDSNYPRFITSLHE